MGNCMGEGSPRMNMVELEEYKERAPLSEALRKKAERMDQGLSFVNKVGQGPV